MSEKRAPSDEFPVARHSRPVPADVMAILMHHTLQQRRSGPARQWRGVSDTGHEDREPSATVGFAEYVKFAQGTGHQIRRSGERIFLKDLLVSQ